MAANCWHVLSAVWPSSETLVISCCCLPDWARLWTIWPDVCVGALVASCCSRCCSIYTFRFVCSPGMLGKVGFKTGVAPHWCHDNEFMHPPALPPRLGGYCCASQPFVIVWQTACSSSLHGPLVVLFMAGSHTGVHLDVQLCVRTTSG